MFASHTQQTLALPFNPPHTVTLQRLSGKALEDAQSAHLRSIVAGRSARGWSAEFQAAIAKGTATTADALKLLSDPLSGLDRLAVVKAGVKAWTCTSPDGKPIEITATTIEDLEDEPLEFLAIEIMRLTKPHLFHADGAVGEQKKAPAPSPQHGGEGAATV